MVTEPINDVVNYYGNKVIDRTFEVVNESQVTPCTHFLFRNSSSEVVSNYR